MLGLEKNQISNSLGLLNLISLEKDVVRILLEYELDLYLLNLVTVFFKKDDSVIEKKKILWNLLINLATNANFACSFLRFKNFKLFTDFMIRTKSLCVFKFIENCVTFCNNNDLLRKMGYLSTELSQMLEQEE